MLLLARQPEIYRDMNFLMLFVYLCCLFSLFIIRDSYTWYVCRIWNRFWLIGILKNWCFQGLSVLSSYVDWFYNWTFSKIRWLTYNCRLIFGLISVLKLLVGCCILRSCNNYVRWCYQLDYLFGVILQHNISNRRYPYYTYQKALS